MQQNKYTFPYIQATSYYRPIIPVTLKHDDTLVEYRALIDSGADFNLFHGEIADILGFFDRFHVAFNYQTKQIVLTPHSL